VTLDAVRRAIRDVPDFPRPGIVFKDITPVLARPELFQAVVDAFAAQFGSVQVDGVAGIEARGFLFAAPLALRLGVGVIPLRKAGKLPYQTVSESYALEYGEASLEIHTDAVRPGDRVLIVDDLLATGGTAEAACRLVERQGGTVAGLAFLVELGFLDGRRRLGGRPMFAPIRYD
jgi:adenine phosphoribosyltransferase